ncbi:MAG: flagellar hook basal-body protein [Verrucomicrobia bacterium]|nr:flagellar hook basal-body protein [Verrucomicrobiota bacterium]
MKKPWRFQTAHIAIVIGSLLVAESLPVRAAIQITGVTQTTGAHSDLAIDGPGWFILRDRDSNTELVTRHGDFRVDINGYLTSVHGFRVQGLKNASLTLHGDLVIDRAGAPPATDPSAHIESFTIDSTGLLWVRLADGTRFIRGQILLQNFAEPDRLIRLAYRLYGSQAAAQPRSEPGPPGSAGLGLIRSGELEIDPEPMRLTAWSASLQTGPRAEGLLTWTRNPTDLGIQGDGFFIVRDPITDESFATRAGAFVLDRDGWLVTYQGERVQGFTDPALVEVGDVRIDGLFRPAAADPSAVVNAFDVGWSGYIRVLLSDGTRYISGQVLRRSFARPNQLQSVGYGLLTSLDAAQPGEWLQSGRPYLSGIRSGMLELVNVPDDVLAQRRTFTWFPQWPAPVNSWTPSFSGTWLRTQQRRGTGS